MSNITFDTTQNVLLTTEKAGIGHRISAIMLDYLFIAAFEILMGLIFSWSNIQNIALVFSVFGSIFFFFYHFIFEAFFDAQSPGKRIMKIKVSKSNGDEAEIIQHLIRALIRPVDTLFGIFPMIFSKNGQRFGDMIAGTLVVKEESDLDLSESVYSNLNESYRPVFSRSKIALLKGSDIELIKSVILEAKKSMRYQAVAAASKKVIDVMEVETDLIAVDFLNTVVKDYSYYEL